MLAAASNMPLSRALYMFLQRTFIASLHAALPGVSIVNEIDCGAPPLSYRFISHSVEGAGVQRVPYDAEYSCQDCKPDMGRGIGCEYTQRCSCLDHAAVCESELARHPDLLYRYATMDDTQKLFETRGFPKRFPYSIQNPPRLDKFYLESRNAIYECNEACQCGLNCKTRVVQKGRKVPLRIFKTTDRGWGVRAGADILRGQFVDTYRGEIITNIEAVERESGKTGMGARVCMFDLDKFVGIDPEVTEDKCYVLDGEHMGGPMSFVNHSCEPNLRQFSVSYNKADRRIYEVAFFAIQHIPMGAELTFDYMDKDEVEDDKAEDAREAALADAANRGRPPCLCKTSRCRGYLWM